MRIRCVVWIDYIKDKLKWKHDVETREVIEVLKSNPRFFLKEKETVEGEHVYNALGRTDAGRYLAVFFIYKKNGDTLILSARDMNEEERKRYAKK